MQDLDPVETQEWLDALESVLDREGEDRAHYLMTRMGELATRSGTPLPYGITTPYRNTIPVTREAKMPGDLFMERRIRSLVRWNALAMVMRANLKDPDLGGHISTFASSATLYDIGIRLRRPDHRQGFVPHFLHQPVDDRGVESGEPHIAAAHNFIGNRRFQEADRTADTGVGRHDYTIDSKLLG